MQGTFFTLELIKTLQIEPLKKEKETHVKWFAATGTHKVDVGHEHLAVQRVVAAGDGQLIAGMLRQTGAGRLRGGGRGGEAVGGGARGRRADWGEGRGGGYGEAGGGLRSRGELRGLRWRGGGGGLGGGGTEGRDQRGR